MNFVKKQRIFLTKYECNLFIYNKLHIFNLSPHARGKERVRRREATLDWMSAQGYRGFPWSLEGHRLKALFPAQTLGERSRPFEDADRGRPSEAPVRLTKSMFLSFFDDVQGDAKPGETLTDRMAWRPCGALPLDATLPERRPLVTFRRQVGLAAIEGLFRDFLDE